MEKRKALERRIYSDPAIPAFFEARGKPFKISPQRNPETGQVEFLAEGKDLDQALQELYSNPQVGVLNFLRALKGYRAAIFALKSGGRNG